MAQRFGRTLLSGISLAFLFFGANARADDLHGKLRAIAADFDVVQFETPMTDATMPAFDALLRRTVDLQRQYPGRAEPLCWQAWILIAQAGAVQDFRIFDLRRTAMAKLQSAVALNPKIYDGAPYVSLGDLHYLGSQFPFPVAYGGEKEAAAYYKKALEMDPAGLVSNAHYAHFLFATKDFSASLRYATAALTAPPLEGRNHADRVLRAEAKRLTAAARERL